MSFKSFICAFTLLNIFTLSSANAYYIDEKFKTEHYSVFEIRLAANEKYDHTLKSIIAKDIARKGKFQTTAAIFPNETKGMNSNIKEPILGIITTENYAQSNKATVFIDDNQKTASAIGIYLNSKSLADIADNRNLNKLVGELAYMPLVITDLKVESASTDYQGNLHYVFATKALLIDFHVIDSIYYTKQELEKVKKDCSVNILAITDRAIDHIPYYMAAHGAVNDYKCNTKN